jgi:hypothetical protein
MKKRKFDDLSDSRKMWAENIFRPQPIFPNELVVMLNSRIKKLFEKIGSSVFVQLGTTYNVEDGVDISSLEKFTSDIWTDVEPTIRAWMNVNNLQPFVSKENGLPEFWLRMHAKHHHTPTHRDLETYGYAEKCMDGKLFTLWVPLQSTTIKTGGLYLQQFKKSKYQVCKPMVAGEGLLFDGNTYHGSKSSSVVRFSLDFRFIPIGKSSS